MITGHSACFTENSLTVPTKTLQRRINKIFNKPLSYSILHTWCTLVQWLVPFQPLQVHFHTINSFSQNNSRRTKHKQALTTTRHIRGRERERTVFVRDLDMEEVKSETRSVRANNLLHSPLKSSSTAYQRVRVPSDRWFTHRQHEPYIANTTKCSQSYKKKKIKNQIKKGWTVYGRMRC